MSSTKDNKQEEVQTTEQNDSMKNLESELKKETKATDKAGGTIHQIGYIAEGDYPDF